MADYNPNTLAAYQQYGQSMMAGGGGSNMSGLGARTSTSSGRVSSRLDDKGFTPTKSTSTASGAKYVSDYGDDDANIPMTPDQIYTAAANAAAEAGSVFAPTGPMANAINLYSMPNMAETATDYVYRADRNDAITSAIRSTQAEEQESVDAAIKSINRAITQGKTDEEIAEAFLNDMGGMGSDEPDPLGGYGVPGVAITDVTGTDAGALSNPQPLYDFAEEMRNPSITTTELPPMSPDEQASLGAAIRKAAEEGTLASKLSNIQNVRFDQEQRTLDWARTLFPDDVNEEGEQIVDTDVDPETGQTIQSADDVPVQSQGLMSRNVYSLEGPESVQDFSDTKTAQLALAGLGYDIGRGGKKNLKNLKIVDKAQTKPSEVRGADGIMGSNTKAAIKAFQEDNGLEVTGELDAATVKALETTPEPTFKYDAGYFNTDKQNDNMTAMYKAAVDAGIEGLELVALMSQAAHESDKFKTAEEYASGNAYEGRTDLGNTQAGDGKRYKGRGYLQITGRTNYKEMGDKLGVDLVNNPEKLEDRNLAAKASVEWWKENVQPLVADFSDVERITKIVNGGFNGLADRQKYFKEFLDR